MDSIIQNYFCENFYISNGFAYTEDHVLVFKLFVCKIPREITKPNVYSYFSSFGHIRNLRFMNTINQHYPYNAFINFESPAAAARILYFHNAEANRIGSTYEVQACYSWQQPHCLPLHRFLRGNYLPVNPGNSIHLLNDDCLEHVLRSMPVCSQLCFARTCSRICQIFQKTSLTLYRTLYLECLDGTTLWQVRDFFEFTGAVVIRVKGKLPRKHHRQIFSSMAQYCLNIEEIDIDTNGEHHNRHYQLLELIRTLTKLKTIKLADSFELVGKDLVPIPPTVENLTVRSCANIRDQDIVSLCEALPNLKKLDLGMCSYITSAMVNSLSQSCPNLETLSAFMKLSDYGLAEKLPNLKNLTVCLPNNCHRPIAPFFYHLAEYKSHIMESLCLIGFNCVDDVIAHIISRLKSLRILDCSCNFKLTIRGIGRFHRLENLEEINLHKCQKITNIALLNLILNCQKLKRVNVVFCYLITNNVVLLLIPKMKQQIRNNTFMRTEPVELIAGLTGIQKNILDYPLYKEFPYLTINLDATLDNQSIYPLTI